MMEQYFSIKNNYKDYILFYRLGDFYEMFFDDAITVSRALGLTLTGRDCGEKERAPMCGVPYHVSEEYIGKLIERGFKVAICEQVEDPAAAKGLVKRDIIRVVTPGTLIETDLLAENKNNYICSVFCDTDGYGVCFCDISTAKICATQISGQGAEKRLQNELATFSPSEIITNHTVGALGETADFIAERIGAMLSAGQAERFDYAHAARTAHEQFGDRLRTDRADERPMICAIGALLGYIAEMQRSKIGYIQDIEIYDGGQYLEMDVNTRRNLELTETMRAKDRKGTLLWALDKTCTSIGARMLRSWLEHPLRSASGIEIRQGAVGELFGNFMLREELADKLSSVLDLERLMTKTVYGTANGKDLRAVASTATVLPEIAALLAPCVDPELSRICRELDCLDDIKARIDETIVDEPPFSVREGKLIREGFSPEVDRLRDIIEGGEGFLHEIEEREREKTGIRTLKVGYNRVFGYYIEVSKSFMNDVPEHYVRKQTLANCERYITQELKELEATVLGASDKINALEYSIFTELREFVAANSERVLKTANLIATLDAYYSLGTVAAKNRYVRPKIDNGDVLDIKDGRHPVVEQFVRDTYFVPNDAILDTDKNRLMLITGPNMAGKSTYMRQVALIVLMAQMGSFVPASEARIGIVDKIFTRVGASDDLASGQSTFMLEMNEVAYILANATKKSLIIYDEVGRGTSTFDGMSIARAIIEYTYGKKIGAKTLFATHYHELTSLEDEFEGIVNYNIAAKKRGDGIIFLRKIVRGSTDDSYGIEVAKLAGLPNEVIKRAREVLAVVERSSKSLTTSDNDAAPVEDDLISIDDMVNEQVIEELRGIDINTLSPYEAMSFLFDLKKRLK
ncbi:MAG: DNA mismatch repair protein MutS [Ruminococcaceae bacterium]|nr:DNA mismatch repair protein MutS [Oscillospiraceae bacterium]